MDQMWANRAASAEAAITTRHLRRVWGLPGTQLGVVAWPATAGHRRFGTWHYWWQAHLLDNLVDAQVRDPAPDSDGDREAGDEAPAQEYGEPGEGVEQPVQMVLICRPCTVLAG